MADVENETGSGSPERVAHDLFLLMLGDLPKKEGVDRIEQRLLLYTACRRATRGGTLADLAKLRS